MATPNILIFMTDQQRAETVFPEHPAITPNLDRFHAQGLRFTDARCPSPHCCPSRATFFSGLYPSQHGVWNNINVPNALSRGLVEGVRLWSEPLAAAGYDLRFSGKWHVDETRGPEAFGWREDHTTAGAHPDRDEAARLAGAWQQFQRIATQPQPERRPSGGVLRPGYGTYVHYGLNETPFNDHQVVDAALANLDEVLAGDKPWCLYAGTLGPHDPYFVPQRFIDLYADMEVELPASFTDRMADKPGLYRRTRARFDALSDAEQRDALRYYYALCSYEDFLFGQLLDRLDASGQADDTIVLYCSDHGDYMGDHGLWAKGLPSFTGCYRVPFSLRWPKGLAAPGRQCAAKVSLADVARTVLDCCDLPEAASWPGSGRSLRPFIENREPADWRRAHCTQSNGNETYGIQRIYDDGTWRFVFNGYDEDELYDLEQDPDQMHNLAKDPAHAGEIDRLCRRMWAFGREHGDQYVNGYIMTALAPVGPASAYDERGEALPHDG